MVNLTRQKCETCNSHIITYEENKIIKVECSHCGKEPENLDFLSDWENDNK